VHVRPPTPTGTGSKEVKGRGVVTQEYQGPFRRYMFIPLDPDAIEEFP
jgi:hypothetical protein